MDQESWIKRWGTRIGIVLVGILVLIGCSGLGTRVLVYDYVEVHEFGYIFDARTGEVAPLDHSGYVATWPMVQEVYVIDTRPVQVCITANVGGASVGARTLNCKLVRFDPEGFETFIEYQGSGNYNGSQLKNTLMAYAYEDAGRDYSFLEVVVEMENESDFPGRY